MSFDYLNEAFKKLELLKEETFDTSPNGLASMKSFMDADLEDDSVRVIDPEADRDEDLQDSYIGKVITNCNVCHSNIFENKEDIVIDEDGTVNAEKQCPYCGEAMGFTVMGEVTEFVPTAEEDDEPKVTVDGEDVPVETPAEEPVSEEPIEEPVEEKLEEELQPTIEKNDDVELEEGKRQYKPHTLKILKMLDEEPLTESKGTIIPEPWNKYLKVDNYEPDIEQGDYQIGDNIGGGFELVAYLTPKRKYEDKFDSWPMLFREHDGELFVGETSHDRVYTWNPEDFGIETLTEAVNNVSVETDDSVVHIESEDSGKVTVSTEPKEPETTSDEAIGPVSDETMAEIEAANAQEEPIEDAEPSVEETPVEDEYEDVDFEEVDEESFDELGESYLKRVYENVDSFRTCDVSSDDNKLIVEGVIKFKSGAEKKTGFIFEAHSAANGKVRFTGMNEHFSRGSKSFALTGKVENKKLISESLTYNYRAKVGNGKSTRIYGTISK